MGNWRRVQIVGTCDKKDVEALKRALAYDYRNDEAGARFHPLVCGGLAGLPMWASETINVVGNLAERDYTPDDVAETYTGLIWVAPSLNILIHCGGDYEADECIATVKRIQDNAYVEPPEIEKVPEIEAAQLTRNLLAQLARR